MKTTRKLTALILILTIVTCSGVFAAEYRQKFWDVPKTHWAFEYIADLTTRGVIAGYEDGSFKPETTVTRAEWAKMMCVAGGINVSDDSVYFLDMEGHWANKYVNAAKNYLTTYNGNSFRPDQAAVREDVTRSLVALRGYNTSDVDYSYIMEFKDFDSISNHMKAYVSVAVEKGLISGFDDGTFRGQATLTRAEAATLLYRAFQKGDANKTATMPTEPYEKPVESPAESTNNKDTTDPQPSVDKTENTLDEPKDNKDQREEPSNDESVDKSELEVTEDESGVKTEDNTVDTDTSQKESNTSQKNETESGAKSVVSEATVLSNDHISSDGENTVYYVNGYKVYAHNIKTEKSVCIVDLKDIEVDTEVAYKTDFGLYSVCYDKSTGGILLFGIYETINSATDKSCRYIYSVVDGEVDVVADDVPSYIDHIYATLDNGDLVTATEVIDRDTLKSKYDYVSYIDGDCPEVMWGYTTDIAETDDTLCYVGVYEYAPDTAWGRQSVMYTEFDTDSEESTAVWEVPGDAWGISNDYVVSHSGQTFSIYNRYGKTIHTVKVKGSNKICSKILVFWDAIVYYDTNKEQLIKISL